MDERRRASSPFVECVSMCAHLAEHVISSSEILLVYEHAEVSPTVLNLYR